ncbi:MAG: nuclear transport factor 2 family protein [Mariprofundaceae bacterium]|nr:nuclear transport factor 2 family protein [Mariprofundaceae bacterium]
MIKLRSRFNYLLCTLILLSSCGFAEKESIEQVLNARDHAVSERDIAAFSALLADDFNENGASKTDKVRAQQQLFEQFEQIQMQSHDRTLTLDGPHAACEQSYSLRVLQDQTWRSLVQRERVLLKKTAAGWQITGGI